MSLYCPNVLVILQNAGSGRPIPARMALMRLYAPLEAFFDHIATLFKTGFVYGLKELCHLEARCANREQ